MDHNSPSSATLTGIFDLFKKRKKVGELSPDIRTDGKTVLITGSSSGLGKAAAIALAKRGARVVMAVRSKIPEAGEEVKKKSGSDLVMMMPLDLANFKSVRRFCDSVKEEKLVFDAAVFNAGVVPGKDRKTVDGFEEMEQVNYLSKFLLVNQLITNGALPSGSRVIFTSSEAHRSAGPVDFTAIGEYREYGMKGSMEQYGYTKVLLTTFFKELVRRYPDILFFAFCPGPVNSNIAREAPKIVQPFLKLFFAVFFRSPKKAAEPIEYFVCSNEVTDKNGLYLHLMAEKPVAPQADDPENGKQLWEKTAELIKT